MIFDFFVVYFKVEFAFNLLCIGEKTVNQTQVKIQNFVVRSVAGVLFHTCMSTNFPIFARFLS